MEPVIIADANRERVDVAWQELHASGLVNPVRHIRSCEALLGYLALYAGDKKRSPAALLIDFDLFSEDAARIVDYVRNEMPLLILTVLANSSADQQQTLESGWAMVDCLLRPLHARDVLGCATRGGHAWAIVSDTRPADAGEPQWRTRAVHLADTAAKRAVEHDHPDRRTQTTSS